MKFGTRFRPKDFDSVLGLENIKEILKLILNKDEYDPAYLFEGEFSSGKTTLGRIFARSILCENRKKDMSPCNECFSCREFLSDRNSNYIEIDAANNGTKEKIQELIDRLTYESITSKLIILLDESHEISKAGNDALLLQLEKQNENVIIIFCTTNANKMSPPLKSRCVKFHLNLPTEELVHKKLTQICEEQEIPYDNDAIYTIVKSSNRHYRDAEITLGVVSKLGDISKDNAEKIVTSFDKEIAYLLGVLPYDLEKTMKAADYLCGCMNIKDIYYSIIKILTDSIKYKNGIIYISKEYTEILQIISKQYDKIAYEVIDYLTSRNRLDDMTFFHSDLLIIHYKFLQDHFSPKVVSSVFKKTDSENNTVEKSEISKGLQYINSRPPWERETLVREYKAKRLQEQQDDRVDERVSSEWGFEDTNATNHDKKDVLKGVVSERNFGEALKESLNEGKI